VKLLWRRRSAKNTTITFGTFESKFSKTASQNGLP